MEAAASNTQESNNVNLTGQAAPSIFGNLLQGAILVYPLHKDEEMVMQRSRRFLAFDRPEHCVRTANNSSHGFRDASKSILAGPLHLLAVRAKRTHANTKHCG